MLEDYVTELKKRLEQRRQQALERLEKTDSNGAHHRGACEAYRYAATDAEELLQEFLTPQDAPPAAHQIDVLKDKSLPSQHAVRQLYGRR